MVTEDDTSNTRPVLVHIDKDDWAEFKAMVGDRQASRQVRSLIREYLSSNRTLTNASR